MSFLIRINCPVKPELESLVQDAYLNNVRVVSDSPTNLRWNGDRVQLYQHSTSTRAVELEYQKQSLQLWVRAMSSTQDWHFAIALAQAVARIVRSPVNLESIGVVEADHLPDHLHSDWIDAEQRSSARITLQLAATRGQITLPGPIRHWSVGPRLTAQFQELDESIRHERMIEQMKDLQWVHEIEACDPATSLTTDEREPKFTLAVWVPDKRAIMPDVQYVVLNDGQSIITLPHDRYLELAAGRFRFLDERTTLIEAFTASELPALYAAARKWDETPRLARSSRSNRPWWRIWTRS